MDIYANFRLNFTFTQYASMTYSFRDTFIDQAFQGAVPNIQEFVENYFKENEIYGGVSVIAQSYNSGTKSFMLYLRGKYTYDFHFRFYTSDGSAVGTTHSESRQYFSGFVSSAPDGTGGLIPAPFSPPDPTKVEKKEDLPFYDELKKTHDLFALDGIDDEEWEFLKAMQQKNEIETINLLMKQSNDDFVNSANNGVYDDVFVRYDESDQDTIDFYTTNGLDTTKDYSVNLRNTGVGYFDETLGQYISADDYTFVNKDGNSTMDLAISDKLVNDGYYIAGLGAVAVGTSALTGGVAPLVTLGAIGVAEYLENKYVDDTTVGNLVNGVKGSYNYLKNLYSGFTNTGDRSTDYVNTKVQQEAIAKNIPGATGVDTTGASIPISVPSTASLGVSVPAETSIGVSVPTDTAIDLNIGDTEYIPLGVMEGTSIPLEITDQQLKLEGLGTTWQSFLTNAVTQLVHKNSLKVNEVKDLDNKILAHTQEYGEDGIRKKEKVVAEWTDTEYKTVTLENGVEVNKINRDVKAWQGMHSLNPAGTITDTIGNDIPISKGIIPAIQGVGMLDAIRETLIDRGNENVLARAKAKSKTKDDEDEKKLVDNLFSILGVKLNAPIPTAEDLRKSPGLAAIYNAISNLSISNTDN